MKLLLFDLDGTLVRTGGSGIRALDRAFESLHGLAGAAGGVSAAGKTDPGIVREIFHQKLGRDPKPDEIRAVCDRYLEFLPEEIQKGPNYRVVKGIPALLEGFAEWDNVMLALGTGNLERGARIKLEPGGLNGYFAFGGYGSDSEDRPQLLAAAVRRAEDRLGRTLPKRDVFVIGDTILDVLAGKAIGATTVAAVTGYGKKEDLKAAGPDILLESFLEPQAFLKALN